MKIHFCYKQSFIKIGHKNKQETKVKLRFSLFLTNNLFLMARYYYLIVFTLLPFLCFPQERDKSEWIDFGGSHYSKYLQIAPGKMGPNALPVPRMDYAQIGDKTEIELGAIYHQMTNDTTVNSFLNIHWNIAPGRAVVEIWGQPSETYHLTNELRDFRQITPDDQGWSTEVGDLWISTYIQLWKETSYLPSLCLNYTTKMTTGSNRNGRYTDANLNYIYLATGKSFHFENSLLDEIRLALLGGFYVWQTNKVAMSQDEGPLIEGGVQFRRKTWSYFAEYGGYKGYDAYDYILRNMGHINSPGYNDPLILRNRIEKTTSVFNFSVEHQMGFRDYAYQTIKVGITYKIGTSNK